MTPKTDVENVESVRRQSTTSSSTIQRLNSIPCACDASPTTASSSCDNDESRQIVESVLADVLVSVFDQISVRSGERPAVARRRPADIEIDCTQPEIEIRVSPRHRRNVATTVRSESSDAVEVQSGHRRHHHHHHRSSQDPERSSQWTKSETVSSSSTTTTR